jgi:aminoglycoside phosphotransferase family enzyme
MEKVIAPSAGVGLAGTVAGARDFRPEPAMKKGIRRPGSSGRAAALRAKVAFLSNRASYPERPVAVDVVQTHMSCVFLTDHHAYKLKKPVRYAFLDFSTLDARRADCEAELRLNRRLAPDVYLELVPLVAAPDGKLVLGGGGEVVDWLVKMRRLPSRLMLDQAIRDASVTPEAVRRFTRVLAEFYRRAEPVVLDGAEHRRRFELEIEASRLELARPEYGLAPNLVDEVGAALSNALAHQAQALEGRIAQRRIVEGHGDLRPEHICLEPVPLFIDCLEFNRDWRLVDPADELSYLALECEFAGAPWIGEIVMATYREASGDDPPAALLHFYKGCRAAVRAKLSAWHLKDHSDPADQGKWIARAQRYLELAAWHATACRG